MNGKEGSNEGRCRTKSAKKVVIKGIEGRREREREREDEIGSWVVAWEGPMAKLKVSWMQLKSVHTTISTFGRSSPFVFWRKHFTLNEMREVFKFFQHWWCLRHSISFLGYKKERKKERQVDGGCY